MVNDISLSEGGGDTIQHYSVSFNKKSWYEREREHHIKNNKRIFAEDHIAREQDISFLKIHNYDFKMPIDAKTNMQYRSSTPNVVKNMCFIKIGNDLSISMKNEKSLEISKTKIILKDYYNEESGIEKLSKIYDEHDYVINLDSFNDVDTCKINPSGDHVEF